MYWSFRIQCRLGQQAIERKCSVWTGRLTSGGGVCLTFDPKQMLEVIERRWTAAVFGLAAHCYATCCNVPRWICPRPVCRACLITSCWGVRNVPERGARRKTSEQEQKKVNQLGLGGILNRSLQDSALVIKHSSHQIYSHLVFFF